ncbi:sensor histidine kinase [Natronorubrum sp. JWXQ-INN-674]|uniref:histidine kinase n=1 Tax=Natronorubrum halalkaliphilum TaxID=2691917 RepID=A0A6B0VN91_9EURY|nr:sensor histidine kinase [Natronorubrum halalkaliphilum]MXV62466.1 sensor histidine kinase [Natronorubrum halalkaliphilum]
MRLVYRFTIAFLIVVLVSGAVLAVTFDAHRTDVAESATASVADRAQLSASAMDDQIQEQQQTVRVAATNPDLTAHGTENQDRALEAFIERTEFDGATVVNETGVVQSYETADSTSGSEGIVGTTLADQQYVRASLDGEQHISDPFHAQTGNLIVVISTPLVDDGEVTGSINAAYHLEDTELFESLDGDEERDAITVKAGSETVYTTADSFDDTIARTVELEATDLAITAHRDRTAVDEQINRLVLFQVVSGIALLGSITAFGGWVYRSKIRRIGQLTERLQALERREYDSSQPLGGAAEWRQIDGALEQLSESLARREQMLLVLNRILRHNLRNALNVVVGRAGDLEERLDGENRESAREIRAATTELLELADRARMTEDLLDPVDNESPRTNLAAVVRERVRLFSHSPEGDDPVAASVASVRSPERAIAACGPEVAVAVDELLENVAVHAGTEPTVAVAVEAADDCVRIGVADDGPGIPPDEAAVITGDRTISQVSHTGGIGLWLVDWIVSRYDGRLQIQPNGSSGEAASATPEGESETTERGSGVPTDDASCDGALVVLEFPSAPAPTANADPANEDADDDREPA